MVNCSRDPELCTAVVCDISDFSSTTISILVLSYVDNRFFRVSFKFFSQSCLSPFLLKKIFEQVFTFFPFNTSHLPFFSPFPALSYFSMQTQTGNFELYMHANFSITTSFVDGPPSSRTSVSLRI